MRCAFMTYLDQISERFLVRRRIRVLAVIDLGDFLVCYNVRTLKCKQIITFSNRSIILQYEFSSPVYTI